MKLLPAALRKQLPPIYANEGVDDPLTFAHFYLSYSDREWYAMEFDGEDTFRGLIWGDDRIELAQFDLSDIRRSRDILGLPAERDLDFVPAPLSKIIAEYKETYPEGEVWVD